MGGFLPILGENLMRRLVFPLALTGALFAVMALPSLPQTQKISDIDRDRVLDMLQEITADVKKHYYDVNLHNLDLDGRVREAESRIRKAGTLGEAFTEIAWALDGLQDSHTYFIPPMRTLHTDYGWQMKMVGDHCFISRVNPKSDAATKELKPGDEVLALNSFQPTRALYPKMDYLFKFLRPMPLMHLKVRSPDGATREMDVMSKQRLEKVHYDTTNEDDFLQYFRARENEEHRRRAEYLEAGDGVSILKLKTFGLDDGQVDEVIHKILKSKALILDLRENDGGSDEALSHVLGAFFDHEVKIAENMGRKPEKPLHTKGSGRSAFNGRLVVLMDSRTAGVAELFARVVQLEKRATVLGDRSYGLVRRGKGFPHRHGTDRRVYYGACITVADLVMTDGKSLEGHGVEPDELILPTPADLAAGRDPVMVRAAELLGLKITPKKAGEFFPYEWPRE